MPAVWNYDEPAVRYLAYRGASKFNEITHLRACLGRGVAPKPWQPLPLKYGAVPADIQLGGRHACYHRSVVPSGKSS